ncbi:MAG: hypothetical protein FWE08_01250 [Oscillospiraceae bacterium]|nr:hypothetical protein [Oscillospiraceae bacterium]
MPKMVLTNELLNENEDFYFDEQNIDWVTDEHDTSWMDLFDETHGGICPTCRSVIICEK